jgi:DNA-binding MarR family transcriptional regulator
VKDSRVERSGASDRQAEALLESVEALALHFVSRASPPAELSRSEGALLGLLTRHDSLSGRQIATATGLACSSVTGAIDRLEARSLVTRTRDEEDRRVVHVSLTAAGRRMARGYLASRLDFVRAMLAPLAPPERDAFVALYHRIATSLRTSDPQE